MPPYVWSVLDLVDNFDVWAKRLWAFQKRPWGFQKRLGGFLKTSPSFLKSSASFSWRGRWDYPLIKPVIPSSPFILSFWFIHTGYQLVKDDSTSPHPPFSRAFQVPSQPAFSNCMSTHLFSPPVSVGADPCVCPRTVHFKLLGSLGGHMVRPYRKVLSKKFKSQKEFYKWKEAERAVTECPFTTGSPINRAFQRLMKGGRKRKLFRL